MHPAGVRMITSKAAIGNNKSKVVTKQRIPLGGMNTISSGDTHNHNVFDIPLFKNLLQFSF